MSLTPWGAGELDRSAAAGRESGFEGTWGVAVRLRAGCLNKCVFCHGYREPTAPTSAAEVSAMLARAGSERRTLFLYGEVLNHPELTAILDAAKANGFERIELQVTAEELPDRELLAALAARGVRSLSFALYGVGAVHDKMVGRPGAFERVRAGLELLREFPTIEVFLHSVATKANVGELAALRDLAASYGRPFWVLPLDPKPEIPGIEGLQTPFAELTRLHGGSAINLLSFPLCVTRRVHPELYETLAASGRDARSDWHRKVEVGVSELTFGYSRIFAFVQPARCGDCAVKRECPGVFQGYLDAFGDAELEPVK